MFKHTPERIWIQEGRQIPVDFSTDKNMMEINSVVIKDWI
jgi:hypothetical protein